MEHRWNSRTDTTIRVTLYHSRIPVIVCRASNISLGGLFVKSGPITYPKDTVLEAHFQLENDQGLYEFHARTCVVYSTGHGLGLMFIKPDTTLLKSIREMSYRSDQNKSPINDLFPEGATAYHLPKNRYR